MFYTVATALTVTGTVTDTSDNPVSDALEKVTDELSPENTDSSYTESNGRYEINLKVSHTGNQYEHT